MNLTLTLYEQQALREIDNFKNPESSWLGATWSTATKPLDWAAELAFDNSVGEAVAKTVHGLCSVLNDGTSWTVRSEAIYEEFREDGRRLAAS